MDCSVTCGLDYQTVSWKGNIYTLAPDANRHIVEMTECANVFQDEAIILSPNELLHLREWLYGVDDAGTQWVLTTITNVRTL